MTQLLLAILMLGEGWSLGGPTPRPRVDLDLGMVFLERRVGSHLTGIDEVLPLEGYMNRERRRILQELWLSELGRAMRSEGAARGGGLIPELRIPIGGSWLGLESKIDIGGSQRISIGGEQTFLTGNLYRDPTVPRTVWAYLPAPVMEQEMVVRVDGGLGDRFNVILDHDSRRLSDAQNTVQLRYQGSEDEVVQRVEMGNTHLAIPNPGRYVGTLPTHKGLFGVSARAKLAGLELYGIASQEQAASQTAEFVGQATVTTDTIYNSRFLWGTLFWVPARGKIRPGQLQVWLDDRSMFNLEGKREGLAVLNPPDTTPPFYFGDRHRGYFRKLIPNQDYRFDYESNILELISPLSRDGSNLPVLGVIYETIEEGLVGDTAWGEDRNSLLLKLIAPPQLDTLSQCWDLELKNVYKIGPLGMRLQEVRIFRDETGVQDLEKETDGPGRDTIFLELLGLDPNRDGRIEYPQFLEDRGWLWFPDPTPFASPRLSQPDSIIYKGYGLPSRGRYYIVVRYTKAAESFSLGQMNITRGSEKVYVGDSLWQPGKDYRLDPDLGTVTFLRPLPPDAKIRIQYEYTPWFAAFRKSLLGARGELKFAQQGRIGGSIFYRSEELGIIRDRPKVGTEPIRRMIGAIDLSHQVQPQWLTRFLDRLPLISTEAPSSLTLTGDAGLSVPDPNLRGYAWLDDFESTTQIQSPGVGHVEWRYTGWSNLAGKDTADFASIPIRWSNPTERERVRRGDVFGEQVENPNERLTSLKVKFTADGPASWAGIMTGYPGGWNLKDLENLEMVLRWRSPSPGRIHIDFGYLSKDAPRRNRAGMIVGYNGRLDTEDRNRNRSLEPEEDTGLDGVAGSDRRYPGIPGDDGNDDFSPKDNLNGTEGNNLLDTEDLDGSIVLGSDDFYRVSVELGNPQFFRGLKGDWKLLQIPLSDTTILRRIGNPRLEAVPLLRIWFDGFEPGEHEFEIVSIEFKGSLWRNKGVGRGAPTAPPVDTTERFEVYPVSKEIDDQYTSPFKVPRDPLTGELEKEAALELRYTRLRPGHFGLIERRATQREDYREYQTVRVYLHPRDAYDPVFLLRIGTDSLSYYEYRARVSEGRRLPYGNWYELEIQLDSFPILKRMAVEDGVSRVVKGGYSVQGESLPTHIRYPSISEVGYLALGVENPGPGEMTGAIWVNDLRLGSPRRDPGYGYQTSIDLTLADLASLRMAHRFQDPNFRTFADPRGARQSNRSLENSLALSLNLHKLLPRSLMINLPINYGLGSTHTRPKYSAYLNDLLIERDLEAGGTTSRTLGFTISKGRSESRLLNYTLDGLSGSYQRSQTISVGELNRDSISTSTSQVGYQVQPNLGFDLLRQRISYFPQQITLSATHSLFRGARWSRTDRDLRFTRTRLETTDALTPRVEVRYSPHQWVQSHFNLSPTLDRRNPPHRGIYLGREVGRNQNLGLSLNPAPILRVVTPRFSYTGGYGETRPEGLEPLNLENRSGIRVEVRIETARLLRHLRDKARDTLPQFGSLHWMGLQLERLGRMLVEPQISYSRTRASSYKGVAKRPELGYQWGLIDSLIDTPYTGAGTRTQQEVYSAASGAKWGDLGMEIGYERSISRSLYYNNNTQTLGVSWPKLSLSLRGFERWLRFFSSASLGSNLNIVEDRSGLIGEPPDRRNRSLNLSPLVRWQGRLRSGVGLELELESSETRSEVVGISTTHTNKRGLKFGLDYTLSAGSELPGFKKLRLRNPLRLTLSLSCSQSRKLLYSRIQPQPIPISSDQNLQAQLSTNYTFSQAVDGGLDLSYFLVENRLSRVQSHSPRLNFWVLFRF